MAVVNVVIYTDNHSQGLSASTTMNDIKPNNIAVERGRNDADLIPIVIDLAKLL